ncbi:MAG: Ser-Thr-rich GPI-anchored membrane family protein [Bacteroidota bacterium]
MCLFRWLNCGAVAGALLLSAGGCKDKDPEPLLVAFFGESEYDLRIVAPAPGDVWNVGGRGLIEWQAKKPFESVNIELLAGTEVVRAIVTGAPDTGRYRWAVPGTFAEGTNYTVRLTGRKGSFGLMVLSGVFGIAVPPYRVLSPDGGEALMPGRTYPVTWSGGRPSASVNLELWQGGVFQSTIATQLANDGAQNWAIPAGTADGTTYRLKVVEYLSPDYNDLSDGDFAIETRPPFILLPHGATEYVAGRTFPVVWDGGAASSAGMLELLQGTTPLQTIASSTSSRPYTWLVGASLAPGGNYRVKLTLGSLWDETDPFTLTAAATVPGDQYEPNDAPQQAWGPLLSREQMRSLISHAGDVDYYRFHLSLLRHVVLYLAVPSGVDYDLTLLGADLSTLATATGSGDEVITRNLSPGTYYVKVSGYGGSASASSPYDLFYVQY